MTTTAGILDERSSAEREELVGLLTTAYWMEIETVMNYISNSVNLDGVLAEEIKKSLSLDIAAELGHAQQFAKRIKTLSGIVPGSAGFTARQTSLQPPSRSTDVVSVIRGVIAAEQAAIQHYNKLIKECDGVDYVTQDLAVTILTDEQNHQAEFEGFLKEYEDR